MCLAADVLGESSLFYLTMFSGIDDWDAYVEHCDALGYEIEYEGQESDDESI